MATAIGPYPATGPDELDALLDSRQDYDNAVDDFMRDLPEPNTDRNNDFAQERPRDVDEEVQVRKKRKPVPKLDEERLLSDAGIPKLRKITKQRLRFKGKGHEFSDMSRLLNTYQLWLDDLYPRAKFRDALAMVEKVGHSKRMQVTRRAWLEETKGRRREDENVERRDGDETMMSGALDGDDLFGDAAEQQQGSGSDDGAQQHEGPPEEDELDALLAEGSNDLQRSNAQQPARSKPAAQRGPFEDDEPNEDELDALLAENGNGNSESTTSGGAQSKPTAQRVPFDDEGPDEYELNALLAEEPTTRIGKTSIGDSHRIAGAQSLKGDDFADEEEALADMGW